MAASSSTTKISPDNGFAKDAASSAIFSGFHARRRPSSRIDVGGRESPGFFLTISVSTDLFLIAKVAGIEAGNAIAAD
jgi:hypothetical protein